MTAAAIGGSIVPVAAKPIPIQLCLRCGDVLADIKGSRLAVCRTCGYKDDCC
ncbi:MAG: hypothetical protein AB7P41_08540 [Dehalococcoidia bacterium]